MDRRRLPSPSPTGRCWAASAGLLQRPSCHLSRPANPLSSAVLRSEPGTGGHPASCLPPLDGPLHTPVGSQCRWPPQRSAPGPRRCPGNRLPGSLAESHSRVCLRSFRSVPVPPAGGAGRRASPSSTDPTRSFTGSRPHSCSRLPLRSRSSPAPGVSSSVPRPRTSSPMPCSLHSSTPPGRWSGGCGSNSSDLRGCRKCSWSSPCSTHGGHPTGRRTHLRHALAPGRGQIPPPLRLCPPGLPLRFWRSSSSAASANSAARAGSPYLPSCCWGSQSFRRTSRSVYQSVLGFAFGMELSIGEMASILLTVALFSSPAAPPVPLPPRPARAGSRH